MIITTKSPTVKLIAEDLDRSAIDAETQALNFVPIEGTTTFDEIYGSNAKRINTGALNRFYMDKWYTFESFQGWLCNGRIKWLGGESHRDQDGKVIRYFSRVGESTPITLITPSQRAIALTEERINFPKPEDMSYWQWIHHYNLPVVITEGEKKAASLICIGIPAISIPGIFTGYSSTRNEWGKTVERNLRAELKQFDTPNRSITIAFDWREGQPSDTVEYKAAVLLSRQFEQATLKLALMSGPFKGVDDAIFAGRMDIVQDAIIGAKIITAIEQRRQWDAYRAFDEYGVKTHNQFFDAAEPENNTVTIVKSNLNSGKSHWIANKISKVVKDVSGKIKATAEGIMLSAGHRNSLQEQLCDRWDFNHLDIHNAYQMFGDPNLRVALCFDSILKLPIETFAPENKVTVILDESVAGIKHLLTGSTLRPNRMRIIKRFEYIIRNAARVILMDGNQANWLIEYVRSISDKKIQCYENISDRAQPDLYFVSDEKVGLKQATEWFNSKIIESELPAIVTDSVVKAEAIAQQLQNLKGDGLLITSKTVTENWARLFLKDPDKYIEQAPIGSINWVVFTPTVESGVSIESEGKFADVFCWFCGVVGINEACQMSRRVRNPKRIIVYAPKVGIFHDNNTGAFESQFLQSLMSKIGTEAQLFPDDEGYDTHDLAVETLLEQVNTPAAHAWAKLQAVDYLERHNYREFLLSAYQAMGLNVTLVDADATESLAYRHAKLDVQLIECQQIFAADNIDWQQCEKLSKQLSSNWLDRCKILKFKLLDRLPGLINSPLWTVDFVHRVRYRERNLISQLESFWLLTHHEESHQLQQLKWDKLRADEFDVFLPDMGDRWLHLEVLRKLNVLGFLDGRSYYVGSPEVVNFVGRIRSRRTISDVVGHPGKGNIMYYLSQRTLKSLGVKLVFRQIRLPATTPGIEGDRQNHYHYDPILSHPDNWAELLNYVENRYLSIITHKIENTLPALTSHSQQLLVKPLHTAVTEAIIFVTDDNRMNGRSDLDEDREEPQDIEPEKFVTAWAYNCKTIAGQILDRAEGLVVNYCNGFIDLLCGDTLHTIAAEDITWEPPDVGWD